MDHELYTEWLQLSVYGELDKDKQALLATHIQSCNECRTEHNELVRMLESISASGVGEPTDEQLISARQRLNAELWEQQSADTVPSEPAPRESFLARWFGAGRRRAENNTSGRFFGYRVAMAGAAVLVIGFFGGYLVFGGAQPVSTPSHTKTSAGGDLLASGDLPPGEEIFTDVSNVHFMNTDAASGEIEMQYDEIRPMRIKAGMDDERVRKLLAHAILTGDNPGLRLQAINILESTGGATPAKEVKQALIGALVSDPNAGVRRQAFLALQRLPFDAEIKETLMFVLDHDENAGLRVAAMDYLTASILEGKNSESAYFDILDSGRR